VVTYDSETANLLDYRVDYLDLAAATSAAAASTTASADNGAAAATSVWKQGEAFSEAFQVPDMSRESLRTIVGDLQNSTDTSVYWEALLNRLHVYTHGSEVCDMTCRREWACTLTSTTKMQYETCVVESWAKSRPFMAGFIAATVLGLVLTMVLLVCYRSTRRCLKHRHYELPVGLELQEYTDVKDREEQREHQLPELS